MTVSSAYIKLFSWDKSPGGNIPNTVYRIRKWARTYTYVYEDHV